MAEAALLAHHHHHDVDADVADTIVNARKSWKTVKGKSEAVWPPQLEKALVKGTRPVPSTLASLCGSLRLHLLTRTPQLSYPTNPPTRATPAHSADSPSAIALSQTTSSSRQACAGRQSRLGRVCSSSRMSTVENNVRSSSKLFLFLLIFFSLC